MDRQVPDVDAFRASPRQGIPTPQVARAATPVRRDPVAPSRTASLPLAAYLAIHKSRRSLESDQIVQDRHIVDSELASNGKWLQAPDVAEDPRVGAPVETTLRSVFISSCHGP